MAFGRVLRETTEKTQAPKGVNSEGNDCGRKCRQGRKGRVESNGMNGNEEEFGNKELKILARDAIPVGSPNTISIEKSLQVEKMLRLLRSI